MDDGVMSGPGMSEEDDHRCRRNFYLSLVTGDAFRVETAALPVGDRLRGWPYRTRTSMCGEKIHLFKMWREFGFE